MAGDGVNHAVLNADSTALGLKAVAPRMVRVNTVRTADTFDTKVFNPRSDVLVDDLGLRFLVSLITISEGRGRVI
jgi:hypothetical protein